MNQQRGGVPKVVAASDELVGVAGCLPTPRLGVAALALALGRAAGSAGVSLDVAIALVRLAHRETDLGLYLAGVPGLPVEDQPS